MLASSAARSGCLTSRPEPPLLLDTAPSSFRTVDLGGRLLQEVAWAYLGSANTSTYGARRAGCRRRPAAVRRAHGPPPHSSPRCPAAPLPPVPAAWLAAWGKLLSAEPLTLVCWNFELGVRRPAARLGEQAVACRASACCPPRHPAPPAPSHPLAPFAPQALLTPSREAAYRRAPAFSCTPEAGDGGSAGSGSVQPSSSTSGSDESGSSGGSGSGGCGDGGAQLRVCFVPWRRDAPLERVETLPFSGQRRLLVPLPLPFPLPPRAYAASDQPWAERNCAGPSGQPYDGVDRWGRRQGSARRPPFGWLAHHTMEDVYRRPDLARCTLESWQPGVQDAGSSGGSSSGVQAAADGWESEAEEEGEAAR